MFFYLTEVTILISVHGHPEFLGAQPYMHCVLIFRVFLSAGAPALTLPPKKLRLKIEKSPNFKIIIIMSCDTDNFWSTFMKFGKYFKDLQKMFKKLLKIDDFECL